MSRIQVRLGWYGVWACLLAGFFVVSGLRRKGDYKSLVLRRECLAKELSQMRLSAGQEPSMLLAQELEKKLSIYKGKVEGLMTAMRPLKMLEYKPITPAQFATQLEQTYREVKESLELHEVDFPEEWYLGFSEHRTSPALLEETSRLSCKREAMAWMHYQFCKSGVTTLLNLRSMPDESGAEKGAGRIREMGFELAFVAKENGVRQFVNRLLNSSDYFFTVDSIRLKLVSISKEGTAERVQDDSSAVMMNQILGRERVVVCMNMRLIYFPPQVELLQF